MASCMTQTITVTGMSCEGCERNVVAAVEPLPGVDSVEADHAADRVHYEGEADPAEVAAAIAEAGYDVV